MTIFEWSALIVAIVAILSIVGLIINSYYQRRATRASEKSAETAAQQERSAIELQVPGFKLSRAGLTKFTMLPVPNRPDIHMSQASFDIINIKPVGIPINEIRYTIEFSDDVMQEDIKLKIYRIVSGAEKRFATFALQPSKRVAVVFTNEIINIGRFGAEKIYFEVQGKSEHLKRITKVHVIVASPIVIEGKPIWGEMELW